MATMKAWRINDCDVYAGHDLEEAIAAAMRDTGWSRDETIGHEEPIEVKLSARVEYERESKYDPEYLTVGQIMAEMTGPGLVCSTEY